MSVLLLSQCAVTNSRIDVNCSSVAASCYFGLTDYCNMRNWSWDYMVGNSDGSKAMQPDQDKLLPLCCRSQYDYLMPGSHWRHRSLFPALVVKRLTF
ncbi:unnamed protein product [Lathyrus oleraceus]